MTLKRGLFLDNLTQTRTANEANEIASISSGVEPTYDDAGNMISGPSPKNSATRLFYVYDSWNRLAAVYTDDGDGTFEPESDDTLVAQYKYDGLNRRTRKIICDQDGDPIADDHYYYNTSGQIVEDRYFQVTYVYWDGTLAESLRYIEQYVWSARYTDSPIVCLHDGNHDGDVGDGYFGTPTSDWRSYYMTDANHNVTTTVRVDNNNYVVNDTAGVNHYAYTAYGTATLYGEDWSDWGAPTVDGPLYAGYWFDHETGLYQVRARYYDPGLSRFVNRDPIGYNGGMNLYAYCGDNPINATDPMGTDFDIDVPVWDFKNGRET